MAQSATVEINGFCQLGPSSPITSWSAAAPSLQPTLDLGLKRTYPEHQEGHLSLEAATDYALPLGTVAAVRFLALRVISGTLQVKVTSAVGTDQSFRLSDLLVLSTPATGDELTAIKLTGTADVEYIAAGV